MRKVSVIIDKITNSIEDAVTNNSHDTEIVVVSQPDLKSITKKDGWRFNWKTEHKNETRTIYKLTISGDVTIQGLISLEPMDNYVEMHLIETAPHNYGQDKKYLGVAGNLVAFACKMSFDLGFEGYVAFTSKTEIIQHYADSLGATLIFRDRMSISTIPAKKLVNSYYK